jgi:hypothetical protein
MATTTKKGSKKKRAKLRGSVVKTSPSEQEQMIAKLRQQLAESLLREEAKDKKLQERDHQLAEALEQQTSTSEILRIIASSPSDLQPVLDAIMRAPRGFAGSMTWCCASASLVLWLRALILVPYLMFALRSVMMIHGFTGCVNMAPCTSLTSASNTIFQH